MDKTHSLSPIFAAAGNISRMFTGLYLLLIIIVFGVLFGSAIVAAFLGWKASARRVLKALSVALVVLGVNLGWAAPGSGQEWALPSAVGTIVVAVFVFFLSRWVRRVELSDGDAP